MPLWAMLVLAASSSSWSELGNAMASGDPREPVPGRRNAPAQVVLALVCSPSTFGCSTKGTAELMAAIPKSFATVRVDREARPDIDGACRRLARPKGYPLACFLTAAGRLVVAEGLGDTVAPRERLRAIAEKVRGDREKGLATLPERSPSVRAGQPSLAELSRVARKSASAGTIPGLAALGDLAVDDGAARAQLADALEGLARGPTRDHVAGGFHRGHLGGEPYFAFEKLLPDNALLLRTYAQAFKATGNLLFRQVVQQLVAWISRDLRQSSGAFRGSIAAESAGKDGGYYLWERTEIERALGPSRSAEFFGVYSLDAPGLLTLKGSPFAGLGETQAALMNRRLRRVRPPTDNRTVVAWNGLMIGALATSGRLLNRGSDVETARRAATAIIDMAGPPEQLRRIGDARGRAFLEDYAYLAAGLLDLFEATGEARWRDLAGRLIDAAVSRFWDVSGGGFFESDKSGSPPLLRYKSAVDTDRPASNAVMVRVLARLAKLTGDKRFSALADRTIQAFRGDMTLGDDTASLAVAATEWLQAREARPGVGSPTPTP